MPKISDTTFYKKGTIEEDDRILVLNKETLDLEYVLKSELTSDFSDKLDINKDALSIANNTIVFTSPKGAIVGNNNNIRSGDLTIVDADANNGNTAVCFHEGPGAPNFINGVIVGNVGEYVADKVNFIVLMRITPGYYFLSYSGEIKNLNAGGTVNYSPIITLVGSANINITQGGSYNEQGATATDQEDGNLTSSIVIGGDTVNAAIAATYVVTYNVTDSGGASATQVTRTVTVTASGISFTAPVISITNPAPSVSFTAPVISISDPIVISFTAPVISIT